MPPGIRITSNRFYRDSKTIRCVDPGIYRDEQRWTESTALYQQVYGELGAVSTNQIVRDLQMLIIDGMVFNAMTIRKPQEAEQVLLTVLIQVPEESAYLRLQLGRHYASGGPPKQSLEPI